MTTSKQDGISTRTNLFLNLGNSDSTPNSVAAYSFVPKQRISNVLLYWRWSQMKSNGTTSLWQNRFGLNFTLENILATKPSFQTFFSEIQHSFPVQIAISFEMNIGLALDICHFFSETAHFCPKLQLTDKIVYTLLNFWYPPKRCLQEKHFCVVPGALRAISKANHPHLLAASQLLAPTTNVSTPLF